MAGQIADLDALLNQSVAAYAAAASRLDQLRAQIGVDRRSLKLAEYQLKLAQETLSLHVVTAYKRGDATLLNALLQTGSFDDLLTRLDYVQHLAGSDSSAISAIAARRTQVLSDRAALQKQLDAATKTAAELAQRRDEVRSRLGQRQQLLRGLKSNIRALTEAELAKPAPVTSTPAPGGGTAPPPTDGWWPAIRAAATANGISANGLNLLMLLESGGSASATNGPYCGLFQYSSGTWKGAWNPWRGADIFDGAAQIKATALAIRQGHGPAWWPLSYPVAFPGN